MQYASRLALLIAACLMPAAAHADTLLANFAYNGASPLPADGSGPEFQPFLSYGDPTNQPALGFLDNVTMGFIDFAQGNTYELTGDFANFAALASNGADNGLYVGYLGPNGVNSWTTLAESAQLSAAFFTAPGVGGPDFAGYDLTRVVVIGTSFSAGLDQAEVTFEFSVYGDRTVPEPGSLALLAIGGAVLVVCGRRRRRRDLARRPLM